MVTRGVGVEPATAPELVARPGGGFVGGVVKRRHHARPRRRRRHGRVAEQAGDANRGDDGEAVAAGHSLEVDIGGGHLQALLDGAVNVLVVLGGNHCAAVRGASCNNLQRLSKGGVSRVPRGRSLLRASDEAVRDSRAGSLSFLRRRRTLAVKAVQAVFWQDPGLNTLWCRVLFRVAYVLVVTK